MFEHFVEAQAAVFARVIDELAAGRKEAHWMWFVFPQLRALGRSPTAQRRWGSRFFRRGAMPKVTHRHRIAGKNGGAPSSLRRPVPARYPRKD